MRQSSSQINTIYQVVARAHFTLYTRPTSLDSTLHPSLPNSSSRITSLLLPASYQLGFCSNSYMAANSFVTQVGRSSVTSFYLSCAMLFLAIPITNVLTAFKSCGNKSFLLLRQMTYHSRTILSKLSEICVVSSVRLGTAVSVCNARLTSSRRWRQHADTSGKACPYTSKSTNWVLERRVFTS